MKPYIIRTPKGLDESIVTSISGYKKEAAWMLAKRIHAYETYRNSTLPAWGPDLSDIHFDDIYYYLKSTDKPAVSWDDLPKEIIDTYEKIGIPEAEKKYLSGVNAQFESEVVYKSMQDTLKKKGVIFLSMDEGLKEFPEMVQKYMGTVVPEKDNIFAALNTSVWSGGSFIYVPKNVHIELPLQAYFRINAANMGQFERTLIIADEGSFVHYVEGCTAPVYSTDSLHSAVVEIIVKKGARVRYSTIQNWSNNIYNLVTKRAVVEEEGVMEWIDGNFGSKVTMKYPSVYLVGRKARGDILSIAFANAGQILDAGAKAIHLAPETNSHIVSKSLTKGGRTSYRGLVYMDPKATKSESVVQCDALLLDTTGRSDTYPMMKNHCTSATISHEATVSSIDEEQLFYLMSKGIEQEEAKSMIVNGFIEPMVKELPLEYAVEMNKLIAYRMEQSVG